MLPSVSKHSWLLKHRSAPLDTSYRDCLRCCIIKALQIHYCAIIPKNEENNDNVGIHNLFKVGLTSLLLASGIQVTNSSMQ